MVFANGWIKKRLLLTCLLSGVVIVCFSAYLTKQIHERLNVYFTTLDKTQALVSLTQLNKQLYQVLTDQLHGRLSNKTVQHVEATILQLKRSFDREYEMDKANGESSLGYRTTMLLDELTSLLHEMSQSEGNDLFLVGNQMFDVLYDFNASVRGQGELLTDVHLRDSAYILNNLRWLNYWMEKEAWLVQEIRSIGAMPPYYVHQYIRASEMQKQFLDQYVKNEARHEHLKMLATLFANDKYRKSESIRNRILYERDKSVDLSAYIVLVEARNLLIARQTQEFRTHFIDELNTHIVESKQYFVYLGIGFLASLFLIFYLCASVLRRIKMKLREMRKTLVDVQGGAQQQRIHSDGEDEFTELAVCINGIMEEQQKHHQNLLNSKLSAESANQSKSAFLATMSHEIRTPLNAIVGMTEILTHTHMNKSQRDVLRDIDTSSQTLLVLLNDILDLSKIESGNLALSMVDTELREVVYDAINMVLIKANKQDVELSLSMDVDLPSKLYVDEYRIKQVLLNLLSNAVKFTEKGRVGVELVYKGMGNKEPACVTLKVIDTGLGIEKEQQAAIFEQFTQKDNTITRRFGGTGLGLAISRQLVELMGGKISVESTLGLGSCFECLIPVQVSEEQASKKPFSMHALLIINGSPYKALIIEECRRYALPITVVETVTEALEDEISADVILYCYNQPNQSKQDLSLIQLKSTASELIVLQHHLHLADQLADVAQATITLPLLGRRFNDALDHVAVKIRKPAQIPSSHHDTPNELVASKILIAEDNLMNQKIASFFLEKIGMEYKIVSNGQEALIAVQSGDKFSAILMDCMMPIMDGLTATKMIREWEQENDKQKLPIIALTASVLQEEVDSCFEAGMDAYLPKPYKSQQLFDVFDQLDIRLSQRQVS